VLLGGKTIVGGLIGGLIGVELVKLAMGIRRSTGDLYAPALAVIRTGERTVVVVAETAQDGRQLFKPVDVEAGAESGGKTEIRKGLERGMKVVTSGQFLIDSEASLKATQARMGEEPAKGAGK